jgi:Ricin-type beta-trefoil lectin domain-like
MSLNLRRLTRFGAIVALVLVSAFVVVPAQPAAADPPISPVKFLLRYNNKCLEADLNNINTNGDAAQLWDCWNDPGNQQWRMFQTDGEYGHSGVYKLVNALSGKCLESNLAYSGNGTPVQLWDCWNDPGNQQWRPEPIAPTLSNPVPGERLVNVLTGQCLDADLGTVNQNGGRLQLWNCWNDPGNERWLVS